MNVLNKLERKFGKFCISNLMLYIVIGTAIVFAFWYIFPTLPLLQYFIFDRNAIFSGQIWRIVSFVFIPENADPISMLFWLFLYWHIGSNLESYWGTFKFNVFYFSGVIFSIIGGFFTGFATAQFINLSLFLAMAAVAPNMELRLFYILPVKMKWLALVYVAMIIRSFILVGWSGKIAIAISLLNVILFFGGDFFRKIRDKFKYGKVRRNFKKNIKMTQYNDED